jgi:serine/threonine protein kinase
MTYAGSELYMAPEMFRKGGQTSKLDVWSLFVTMLWTLDIGGFRQRWHQFKSAEDA